MASFSLILDIDEQGIKALIIKETIKGVDIEDSCHVFTKDLITGEQSEEKEERNFFFESLKSISIKIDLKNCSTATLFIPSSIVSFRNTTLPFKSKRKIRKVLDYELEFMLPLNNTKYLSDFILTDISLSESQNYIFSASVSKDLVENYFASLLHFGIKPELITIKGYVKADWLVRKEEVTKILFLDIQGDEKTITFVINSKVVFLRSLQFFNSEQDFVQTVFNTYLGFKQKTRIDILFDKIIITSDQDPNDDLSDAFKARFQCPVEYAMVGGEDLLTFLLKDRKSFLNLCQAQYKSDSYFKKNIKKIVATAAIAFFLFILSLFSMHLDIYSLEKEISLYKDAQIAIFKQTFPKQTKIDDPFMQMRANVAASKGAKSKKDTNILTKKGIRAIDLMFELSERIPDNVDILVSRLLYNNERLTFSGLTDDFNNIEKIKNSLEESDIFSHVNISKAAADKKDGKVLFKFIIKFQD